MALGIATALHYLHEDVKQCVLHRDIKSANVLLDTNFSTKLGDFGMVKLVDLTLKTQRTGVVVTYGDLPVVISCASLALDDAGIMMYDLVASVSMSCLNKNLVIDPIFEKENSQDESLMITCMPSRDEITQLTFTGEWSTLKIYEGMQLCLDACAKLAKIMRSYLKEAASNSQE
ncbi:exosome complex component RRP41-like [Arachis stenosperma]|uniref:exosome complex component RRP41-like n=1 Tax=Arachis stenosperma TaxID=217475 RepID=UPI0025ACA7A8|nr:exosome complex component RRP41-like [Arachis stenosperma]